MTARGLTLLALLFVGHFLGDFTPLATDRMQEAKRNGAPLAPIVLHALVHAILVGVAVAAIARPTGMFLLAAVAVEFGTHFALDWWKGAVSAVRPALGDPERPAFWTVLGLDQLAHALVLLAIAWLVLP